MRDRREAARAWVRAGLGAFTRPSEAVAEAIRRIFLRTAAASFGGKCESRFSAESTINLRTFSNSDFPGLAMDRDSPTPELSGDAALHKIAGKRLPLLINPLRAQWAILPFGLILLS